MNQSVLVIGGGIAGIRAALDLAKGGAHVLLVERAPTVGGKMAAVLDEESPPLDLAEGVWIPKMTAVGERNDIEVLTLAEVAGLAGEPGRFTVRIRQRARYVTDACTQCNRCRQVCPVVAPNEFDSGMAFRKAIYSPFQRSVPKAFVIDIASCLNDPPNYLPCQRCVQVCEPHCIDFSMAAEKTFEREVGAVVVAVGFDLVDPSTLANLGYGRHPDVLNSMELERLLASTGPTGGFLEKPSNEEEPENVLFILCDTSIFTWNYAARHTARLVAQDIADVTVLYPDRAALMGSFEEFWRQKGGPGVKLIWGQPRQVHPNGTNGLQVEFRNADTGETVAQDFDIVVLATGIQPVTGLGNLAEALDIDLGRDGFIRVLETDLNHVTTTRPGVYVAGCASGPKDIPTTLHEAGLAATRALSHIESRPLASAEEGTDGRSGLFVQGKLLSPEELGRRIEHLLWSIVALGEQNRS